MAEGAEHMLDPAGGAVDRQMANIPIIAAARRHDGLLIDAFGVVVLTRQLSNDGVDAFRGAFYNTTVRLRNEPLRFPKWRDGGSW